MSALCAFLDESGDASDPLCRAVGVAGCIVPSGARQRIQSEWCRVLEEFRVSWFHAADVEYRRKEWEGWSKERVVKFRSVLLDLMDQTSLRYVGCVVELSMYRAAKAAGDDAHDPYFVCYQTCADEAARIGGQLAPGAALEITVARRAKFVGRVQALHAALLELSPHRDRLPAAPMIATPQHLVELQIADFVAFELGRYQRGIGVRPEFRRLRKNARFRFKPENRLFEGYLGDGTP